MPKIVSDHLGKDIIADNMELVLHHSCDADINKLMRDIYYFESKHEDYTNVLVDCHGRHELMKSIFVSVSYYILFRLTP